MRCLVARPKPASQLFLPLIQQSRRACSDKNQNENPAALPFAMLVLFAGSNQKSSELIIDNAVPLSI
jgi:hypothetical protein